MIRNVPVKLWERIPYRKFENPTDIIYPCILYLPIKDVIGQDRDETTVWNCSTKKWEKKIRYERYKLVFNVYGRNFSCVERQKYKIGEMKFVYLDKGFHNNGELILASLWHILDYELKKYKSLQVRIISIRKCDLPTINCYWSANIRILSRYSSDTINIENVRVLGYIDYNSIPQNTIGMEINSIPYENLTRNKYSSYPVGYYINLANIICFCVSSFETPSRHIEAKKNTQTNNTDNWLIYNTDKIILPIIAIVFIILLLILI